MRLFMDSSALAKRYVVEPGSELVRERLAETTELLLSVLALPETISALVRLRGERRLSESGYQARKRFVAADFADATVFGLTPEILERTVTCLEASRLRASDAVQVATALEAGPDLFLSADHRQCEAARALGLNVEGIG